VPAPAGPRASCRVTVATVPTAQGPHFAIEYEVHGAGEGGKVVLVCGTGQPATMWSAVGALTGLNDAGYRVVTFDNRGMTGAACPEPPWTVDDMADDAIAVLEAVGRSYVVGASLGALITQNVSLRRPDLVRGAIFLVGGGNFSPSFRQALDAFVALYEQQIEPPKALEHFVMLQAMLTPDQRADPSMVELALSMSAALTETFGPGGQYGQYSANARWASEDHIAELARLDVPALVVANEFDPIFPARCLRDVAKAAPDCTYVEVPDVSHVAWDPASNEIVLAAMREFLASH
jgi:pimeloyl-ACP methyl ester carboxylesterase